MREFTVKDIAELLGVSKPTIQRAINAAAIDAAREDKQTRYYDLDAAAAISEKVKPGFDFSACVGCSDTPQNDSEHRQKPQNDAEQTATPPQDSSIELMRAMLITIQEQLAAKDKQIAAYEAQIAMQNDQIKEYSDRLKEAMELTRGQQYIAAADKTVELLETTAGQSENPDTLQHKNNTDIDKKSFWKKLFRKDL